MRRSTRTSPTTLRALAVAVTAAALLGACGGGSKKTSTNTTQTDAITTSSKKHSTPDTGGLHSGSYSSSTKSGTGFVDAANKACRSHSDDYIEGFVDLSAKYKYSSQPFAAAEATLTVKLDEQRLTALQDLTPPKELASDWKAYLSALREKLELRKEQQQAVQDDDSAAFQAAAEQDAASDDKVQQLATNLGLDSCSGHDGTASDAKDITSLVKTTATTSDPEFCTNEFTEGFVLENFGSEQDCESQQQGTGSIATIEVGEPYIVDKYADVTLVAHPSGGASSKKGSALLYRDGDSWRLASVNFSS